MDAALPAVASTTPPHPFFDPVPNLTGDTATLACDRLVRHLFDVGLQLHTLQAIFDQPHTTPEQMRAASDAVGIVLGDLDTLIHDAGLAMLAHSADSIPPLTGNGKPSRQRRRR
ncbi:hypothetical protein [Nocardia wallacei]|uniref:hypothetical protein n=1 Tax=Nocardia wallacei TaxID=480035 RepID=UPI0024538314|nr:hypothetical protein [Nocardia wallacei]